MQRKMQGAHDNFDGAVQPFPKAVFQSGINIEDEADPQPEEHEKESGVGSRRRGQGRSTRNMKPKNTLRRSRSKLGGNGGVEDPSIEEIDESHQKCEALVVER